MSTAIKLRGDSTANWSINNPLLLEREIAVDTTLLRFKIGDGVTLYNSLPYMDAALVTELGLKAPLANPAFTGAATLNGEPLGINANLNGTAYLMVYGTGTPAENASELQAAYDEATNMPRYLGEFPDQDPAKLNVGQTYFDTVESLYYVVINTGTLRSVITEAEAKSVRTTLIVAPGRYGTIIPTPTDGVEIVSLTGKDDVIINDIGMYGLPNNDLTPYVKKSDIVDNLSTVDSAKALSASMGKFLNDTKLSLVKLDSSELGNMTYNPIYQTGYSYFSTAENKVYQAITRGEAGDGWVEIATIDNRIYIIEDGSYPGLFISNGAGGLTKIA